MVPMKQLDFESLRLANLERVEDPKGFNHNINDWSLSDWMTATMGELGEAANNIKKLNRIRDGVRGNSQGELQYRENVAREIGDTAIYLDLLATRLGVRLEDCIRMVWNGKSREIGYDGEI